MVQAIPIHPSRIFQEGHEKNGLFDGGLVIPVQIFRAILVGLIFMTLAVAAGIFTYPAWEVSPVTFRAIMDVVVKQPLPSQETIITAIMCGIVFGWICFVSWRPKDDQSDSGNVTGFTKLLGGMMILLGTDIYLFQINPLDISDLSASFTRYGHAVYAQGITFILILMFSILYRALAPLSRSVHIHPNFSERQANVYGWTRLVIVCMVLAGLIAFLVTFSLPGNVNQPVLFNFELGHIQVLVTQPLLASLASALAVEGLCCWPPGFRNLKGKTGVLRLLIIVGCLGAVLIIYRNAIDTAVLAATIPYSVGLMILSLPLQRSIS